jgi:hypothetical protein
VVPSFIKSPKGFRRSYEDKVFFKEIAKSRGRNSLKNNWTELPLQYANLSWNKFHQNPPNGLGVAKTKLKGWTDR